MTHTLKSIEISQLQRGQYQPRRVFDESSLSELAASIRTQGLIEPIIVREVSLNQYEIIAGERRWRAAMLAGLKSVPCLIGDYADKDAAVVSLIENVQRADLNGIEEAAGYQRLLDEFQFKQDEVASLVGKSRSHVANTVRLLTLSEAIKALIAAGQLTIGHARTLVGLTPPKQLFFATESIRRNWSVRQLERAIQNLHRVTKAPHLIENCDRMRLQMALAEYLGTPVEIQADSRQSGVIQITFYDHDTLAGLLDKIGFADSEAY